MIIRDDKDARTMQQPTPTKTVFDVITDFLAATPSAEAILAYRLPEVIEKRAIALVERHNEGDLSADEEIEMFDYMRADDMMTLLKAKTRRRLADGG